MDHDDDLDINMSWQSTRGNINASAAERLGYYEMKHHKPWFDQERSKY
jgi:hypothetical protein